MCLISYLYCYYVLIAGFPLSMADIPEFGKYVNIMAGITMSTGKWIFIYWKRHELAQLVDLMNERSQRLRQRGTHDPHIKRLRNTYFVHEMFVFLLTVSGSVVFVVCIYAQLLFVQPLALIIPATLPFHVPYLGDNFAVAFAIQVSVCVVISQVLNCSTTMIGNVYSQILLHLDVLKYDCELLDRNDSLTAADLIAGFRDLSRGYQSVVELHEKCNHCMRALFLNDVLASMIAVIFSCVEIGIVVNQDLGACFRPVFYFIFLYTLFFYWSWLGSRLAEKVSGGRGVD